MLAKIQIILLLLIGLGLAACSKEGSSHVAVETHRPTQVTSVDAILHGSIAEAADGPITAHGFIYHTTAEALSLEGAATRQDFGEKNGPGSFSYEVKLLKPQHSYYARAYAMSGDKVFYGPVVSFRTHAPQFHSFSPEEGRPGDIITIRGRHLTADLPAIKVYFNETEATILQTDTATVQVRVPAITSSMALIKVEIGKELISNGNWFRNAE
jgi:hypothetical protein